MNSTGGFSTKKWGAGLWRVIHLAALNYPLTPTIKEAHDYYCFFKSLSSILPCRECRTEFTKMTCADSTLRLTRNRFAQLPGEPAGSARRRLFAYTLRIHARVDKRLGKRVRTADHWTKFYLRMRTK